jgi:outer membrane protein assembly factor BamB
MATKLGNRVSLKSLQVVYPAADVKVLRQLSRYETGLLRSALGSPNTPAGLAAITAFVASYRINHLGPFDASIKEGIKAAADELQTESVQCPNTRFVLAGYSQGAMVMHQLLLRLADAGKSALLARIAASALIADGDKKKETTATRFGTSSFEAEGIRSAFVLGERDVPSIKASSTFDVCNADDLVCDFRLASLLSKTAEKIHTDSYKKGLLVANIGTRIADLILGGTVPSVQGIWQEDGFGADRSGVNLTETTIAPGNVASIRLSWQHAEAADQFFSRPVVSGQSVFLVSWGMAGSRLLALDLVSGALQWQRALLGGAYQAPVISGSTVIVQSTSGVFAFSAVNGSPRWNNDSLPATDCRAGNVAVEGSTLYAFTSSGVSAVDVATGATRWTTSADVRCFTGVAVSRGRVFVVSRSIPNGSSVQTGEMRALDALTGATLWSRTTATTMDANPVAGDGLVLVDTQYAAQGLVAFDQQTGQIRWQRKDVLGYGQATAVTANAVIVTSADGGAGTPPAVRALMPSTGANLWSRSISNAVADGDPVVANGLVYFGSTGDPRAVFAVRLDNGAQAAEIQLGGSGGGNSSVSPIVVAGTLFAAVTPNGPGTPTAPTLMAFRLP